MEINLFKHRHKWEVLGVNRWGLPTYRVCRKCGKAQERINKPFEDDKWDYCDRIIELDNQ